MTAGGLDLAADVAALAALGTADAIADALRADGDCGVVNEPESCALANRFSRLGHEGVSVWKHLTIDDEYVIRIETGDEIEEAPPVLRSFVDRFDAGLYPDLITEECQ